MISDKPVFSGGLVFPSAPAMPLRLIVFLILCCVAVTNGWGAVRASSGLPSRSTSTFVQTTKVKNRARSLSTQLSGNSTRYWAVTDADLRTAQTRAETIARLTPPPVGPRDGVRRYSVVVDIRNPLFLDLARQQVARVGSVEALRGVSRLEVTTIIENAQIYSSRKTGNYIASKN